MQQFDQLLDLLIQRNRCHDNWLVRHAYTGRKESGIERGRVQILAAGIVLGGMINTIRNNHDDQVVERVLQEVIIGIYDEYIFRSLFKCSSIKIYMSDNLE